MIVLCCDFVIVVVQGLNVCEKVWVMVFFVCVVISEFKLFNVVQVVGMLFGDFIIVCIGYIGEDGFEVIVLVVYVEVLWNVLQ